MMVLDEDREFELFNLNYFFLNFLFWQWRGGVEDFSDSCEIERITPIHTKALMIKKKRLPSSDNSRHLL